jgi:hypothetical protein
VERLDGLGAALALPLHGERGLLGLCGGHGEGYDECMQVWKSLRCRGRKEERRAKELFSRSW